MKNILIISTILTMGLSQALANSNNELTNVFQEHRDTTEITENVDQVVQLTGINKNNINYFQLTIKNESHKSVYSLVREYKNGEFESVEVRFGVENNINQPILYSFMDDEFPNLDFTYVLYRISALNGTEIMKKWDYCSLNQELCDTQINTVAFVQD